MRKFYSIGLALVAWAGLLGVAGPANAAPADPQLTCHLDGQTRVSGWKGDPVWIEFVWEDSQGGMTTDGFSDNPAEHPNTFALDTPPPTVADLPTVKVLAILQFDGHMVRLVADCH